MIKQLTTLLFLSIAVSSFAQPVKKLPKKPISVEVPEEFQESPAIILSRSFDQTSFRPKYYEAVLFNDAEAIQDFNTFVLLANAKVLSFKGRIIRPNGQIIKLTKKDVTIKTDVNKRVTLVFRGLREGDILEYYIMQGLPGESSLVRNQVTFDDKYPILHFNMYTVIPFIKEKYWEYDESYFEAAKFNQFQNIKPIPPELNEPFARNIRNKPFIRKTHDYRISFTKDEDKKRDSEWRNFVRNIGKIQSDNSLSLNIYNDLYDSIPRNSTNTKSIIFSSSDIAKLMIAKNITEHSDILNEFNRYLKSNYSVVQHTRLIRGLETDAAGRTKMGYGQYISSINTVLEKFEINHEFYFTTNRFLGSADNIGNETPYMFRDVLIYFPDLDIYWELINPSHAPGMASSGLFDQPTGASLDGKFVEKTHAFPAYLASKSIRNLNVSLPKEGSNDISFSFEREDHGFERNNNVVYWHNINTSGTSEEINNFIEYLIGRGVDWEINDKEWVNGNIYRIDVKNPSIFEANGQIKTVLLEDFGSKGSEFSIGKLLGKQMDLRQVNIRYQDIDMSNPFEKIWTIKVDLNGRAAANLEDLNTSKSLIVDGDIIAEVKSEAHIDGGKLVWTVSEIFHDYNISKNNYQDFRNLINHIADLHEVRIFLTM